jgi:glutamate racemase
LRRADCGTIILGCTHYPFLRAAIESAAGPSVRIIDPAEETVSSLEKILLDRSLASESLDCPHEFYASGDAADFATFGSEFLGRKIDRVTSHQSSSARAAADGCVGREAL